MARKRTAMCKDHADSDCCVWCVGTYEPTIEEVLECMKEECEIP